MCNTPSFNPKYRVVDTYQTYKSAIDPMIMNWNEIISIVDEMSTAAES